VKQGDLALLMRLCVEAEVEWEEATFACTSSSVGVGVC